MKTLIREKSFILWDQWWDEMHKEWFKIEVLQDYSGEDSGPSLDAWLTDNQEKSIELMHGEMKDWIAMCRKSPARKRRFHVVNEPFTPYMEWEIELYRKVNIPLAGEAVHLVPSNSVSHLSIPDGDVMIFDEMRVARAYYNSERKVHKMDFYDAIDDDITNFLELRSEISKFAVPIKF